MTAVDKSHGYWRWSAKPRSERNLYRMAMRRKGNTEFIPIFRAQLKSQLRRLNVKLYNGQPCARNTTELFPAVGRYFIALRVI